MKRKSSTMRPGLLHGGHGETPLQRVALGGSDIVKTGVAEGGKGLGIGVRSYVTERQKRKVGIHVHPAMTQIGLDGRRRFFHGNAHWVPSVPPKKFDLIGVARGQDLLIIPTAALTGLLRHLAANVKGDGQFRIPRGLGAGVARLDAIA